MREPRAFSLDPYQADWKGLDQVLAEIADTSPGVRLDHTHKNIEEYEAWRGLPEKRMLPVERWLSIVRNDIARSPTPEWREVIAGPHYYWGFDELGRIIIGTNHQGRIAIMFEEPWAGEPD